MDDVVLEVRSGARMWRIRLVDGPASRALVGQLPLDLDLKDFAGTERIAKLPRPLPIDGAPAAITPVAADVAYYAPWGNIAIFHGDGHLSPGLVRLGRIEGDLSALRGRGTLHVTIRRATVGGHAG